MLNALTLAAYVMFSQYQIARIKAFASDLARFVGSVRVNNDNHNTDCRVKFED
jgi:hypothetical protein